MCIRDRIHAERNSSKVEVVKFDTTFFDFQAATNSSPEIHLSQLDRKTRPLKQSIQQYEVKRIGRIKTESSVVFKAIINKPELCTYPKMCYKIKDIQSFKNSIREINYARIEGKKKNKHASYSKVGIEEIIFDMETNASTLLSYINHVRELEYFWDSIDKSPSNIFRENNKLYFVRIMNNTSQKYPAEITNLMKE